MPSKAPRAFAVPFPSPTDEENWQALEAWSFDLEQSVNDAQENEPTQDPPPAPTGLSVAQSIDHNAQDDFVAVVFSWDTVSDAVYYLFRLAEQGDSDFYNQRVEGTALRLAGLKTSTNYEFQVASVDKWGQVSAWSDAHLFSTPDDDNAPPQVTGVSVFSGIRTLVITWDAVTVPDLAEYEVQVSKGAGFTSILDSTKLQAVNWAWEPDTPPTSDTTYYIRVRAIDRSGNAGLWSSDDGVGPASGNLGPGFSAITEWDIEDTAIKNAHIKNATIKSAKIQDLVADKIIAGTFQATVTVSGLFKTADTGRRVEFNNNGIRGYNSAGDVLFSLRTWTDPIFVLRTATSGSRTEFDGDGIRFLVRQADAAQSDQELRWHRLGDANPTFTINTVHSSAGDIGVNFALESQDSSVLNDLIFSVIDDGGNSRSQIFVRETNPRIDLRTLNPGSLHLRMAFWHNDDLIAHNADEHRFSSSLDTDNLHLSVGPTPGDRDTALNTLQYRGPGGTVKRNSVTVGNTDSGGTGFRVLRVPN